VYRRGFTPSGLLLAAPPPPPPPAPGADTPAPPREVKVGELGKAALGPCFGEENGSAPAAAAAAPVAWEGEGMAGAAEEEDENGSGRSGCKEDEDAAAAAAAWGRVLDHRCCCCCCCIVDWLREIGSDMARWLGVWGLFGPPAPLAAAAGMVPPLVVAPVGDDNDSAPIPIPGVTIASPS